MEQQGGSLYLPTKSDCMTLLLCEEGEHPSLFFLLRFDPVEGRIPIFAFPQQLVLTHKQVAEPAEKIFAAHGIEGIRQALQESWKLPVDRYLMLSKEAAVELLQQFGPTALTLPEQVELTVGGIGITLEKGVQLLDGQRLWELLRKEVPADTLLQCELLPELMALCINQHLEYLQQDYSSSLFSAAVNAGTSDLVFSDYDTRRQAACLPLPTLRGAGAAADGGVCAQPRRHPLPLRRQFAKGSGRLWRAGRPDTKLLTSGANWV